MLFRSVSQSRYRKKLLIPKNSVVLDDRIKIGTNNFRVTYINDSGFDGLFEVQVSVDLRV